MTDEARILAYVDGELDDAGRSALEAEMAADPAVADAVARHAALRSQVASAFAGVLHEPVPQRLTNAAQATQILAFKPKPQFGLPQWAAMAACLVVGVFAGRILLAESGSLTPGVDGALGARGALAAALDEQLAAQAAGPVKVGLSFRTAEGRYCRTFESAPDKLAGVACREGGRWLAVMTARHVAPREPSPDYRTAGSETPAPVLAAVDELIAGEPLDAAGEAAARARGWKD